MFDRKYSSDSKEAIHKIEQLSINVSELENSFNKLKEKLKRDDSKIFIGKAITEVTLLCGALDKIQYSGVDSIITATLKTGKDDAQVERKRLNFNCEALRQKLVILHQFLNEIK